MTSGSRREFRCFVGSGGEDNGGVEKVAVLGLGIENLALTNFYCKRVRR